MCDSRELYIRENFWLFRRSKHFLVLVKLLLFYLVKITPTQK